MAAEKTAGEQRRGRPFPTGRSGNPRGRPPGSRHAAHLALDAIGQAGAQKALRAVVRAAGAGDLRAAEILLARAWPPRRGRPVMLDLPPVQTATDLPLALAAILAAVGRGDLTADEGQAVADVARGLAQAIETADLEQRLAALEMAARDADRT